MDEDYDSISQLDQWQHSLLDFIANRMGGSITNTARVPMAKSVCILCEKIVFGVKNYDLFI